jgi:hypothetical protein
MEKQSIDVKKSIINSDLLDEGSGDESTVLSRQKKVFDPPTLNNPVNIVKKLKQQYD